ncbi:hypothetical protein Cgig2_026798 [Carnegiea gigantea]|uniref:Uncharacterized protein n=1 Tax=Carnegiea gigantea TaxID=171969 RepID=A0A9Q1GGJ9_9CARY|nr:hypothetical protein Cgig2_026798 [Carnegiea gigantea]
MLVFSLSPYISICRLPITTIDLQLRTKEYSTHKEKEGNLGLHRKKGRRANAEQKPRAMQGRTMLNKGFRQRNYKKLERRRFIVIMTKRRMPLVIKITVWWIKPTLHAPLLTLWGIQKRMLICCWDLNLMNEHSRMVKSQRRRQLLIRSQEISHLQGLNRPLISQSLVPSCFSKQGYIRSNLLKPIFQHQSPPTLGIGFSKFVVSSQ